MSTDYFAHAAFGVPMKQKHVKLIQAAVGRLEDGEGLAGPLSDNVDEILTELEARKPGILAAWAAEYGLPAGGGPIYTDDEDDRPGRCQCPADTWLYGVGMYAFGPKEPALPAAFCEKAEWYTWVTSG